MDFHNGRKAAFTELYERLPNLDFSRQILGTTAAPTLRVEPVANCGWSDLGTPERVVQAILRLVCAGRLPARQFKNAEGEVDLATRYRQLHPETLPELRAMA